ncbi:hypothetical protein HDV01_002236 [Terramyces sp. JEL0728]|nr:hypothetical protein HDV01_002236 [Terramyces sp. JEL0728]
MPTTPAFAVALKAQDEYVQEYESGLNGSVVSVNGPVSIVIANYDYRAVIVIPSDGYNLPQKGKIGRLAVAVVLDSVVIFAQTIQAQTTIHVKTHQTLTHELPIVLKENSVLQVKLMMVEVLGEQKGCSRWPSVASTQETLDVNEYSVDYKQVRSLQCIQKEILLALTIKNQKEICDLNPRKLPDSTFTVPTKLVTSFPVCMKSKHDANILFKTGGIRKRKSADFRIKNPVLKHRHSIAAFAKLKISE